MKSFDNTFHCVIFTIKATTASAKLLPKCDSNVEALTTSFELLYNFTDLREFEITIQTRTMPEGGSCTKITDPFLIGRKALSTLLLTMTISAVNDVLQSVKHRTITELS